MSITRKLLKGMGLTEEQVDTIIEAHTDVVDDLKKQIGAYKSDAEKLPTVQKELDDLKKAGDGGYKEKYEKERKDFSDYKAAQEAKETRTAKEKAARAYYQSKGITGKALEIAMRGSNAEVDALELDGEKIKDPKALEDLIFGDFSGLVSKTEIKGAETPTPPASDGAGKLHGSGRAAKIAAAYHENLYGKGE